MLHFLPTLKEEPVKTEQKRRAGGANSHKMLSPGGFEMR